MTFLDMITAPPKGLRKLPPFRPEVGTRCLVSGPNCDDNNGHTFGETTVLWSDETFVLYGNEGFWPCLHKWEHCIFRPLASMADAQEQDQ